MYATLIDAMDGRFSTYTPDSLREALPGWELVPVMHDGALAAVLMVKEAEVHVAALPQFRGKWLSRKKLVIILKPILDRRGYLTTRVMPDNHAGHAFVRRLGFTPLPSGEYRLEKLAHA